MNLKDITCCVVDNGIFIHVARRLAREYKKVYYWSPADRAFPVLRERCVGDGYPDIVRVEHPLQVKHECDLFVFPDIGHCHLQSELIEQGYPVWGARMGDSIEINRGKFIKELGKTSLPYAPNQTVKGITQLREFLKNEQDKYIKVSRIRGDFETFHWRSWEEDEVTLDKYAVLFGPLRDHLIFYVFDPIDSEIEDGIDAYCIDGKWPKTIIHGMECKDKAYLGTFQKFADCPPVMQQVNLAFGPILESYGYRSCFSSEVRITESGEGFFIDPTCRFGSPPSQVQMEMVANWGQIIWEGAHGNLVEMEPAAKFGVQCLLKFKRENWTVIPLPLTMDRWVKVSFSCMVDGDICVPPDTEDVQEIAWLVAVGDSIQETIDTLKAHAEELPDGICCEIPSMVDLIHEIEKAEEAGMEFTDQPVPDAAEVI
jgi:hypothetical protein